MIYTKEQINEIIKCSNDAEYFITKYVEIRNLYINGSFVPNFHINQLDTIKLFIDNNKILTKNARQNGNTTIHSALIMWSLLFNKAESTLILSNKIEHSESLLHRIEQMTNDLPKFLTNHMNNLNITVDHINNLDKHNNHYDVINYDTNLDDLSSIDIKRLLEKSSKLLISAKLYTKSDIRFKDFTVGVFNCNFNNDQIKESNING